MIDLHCHILHDIDDGAQSIDDSLMLCRCAVDNDITACVSTSHLAKPVEVDEFISLRDRNLSELKEAVSKRSIPLEILPGAEVFVDDDIFYAPALDEATINHTSYLLIEFSFYGLTVNRIFRYLDEIKSRGYIPIIAHPERYKYTQQNYDIINFLADSGQLFQVNASSLAGRGEDYELAKAMVEAGMVSFIASDAHSVRHRPNDLKEMRIYFPESVPSEEYDKMLDDNPRAVLRGEKVEPSFFHSISRRRFRR